LFTVANLPGPMAALLPTLPRRAAIRAAPTLPDFVVRQLSGGRPLESRWVPAGLAAGALLAGVAWWLARRHRAAARATPSRPRTAARAVPSPHRAVAGAVRSPRRPPRGLVAGLGAACCVLLVLATLASVNSYVGYVPTLGSLLNRLPRAGHAARRRPLVALPRDLRRAVAPLDGVAGPGSRIVEVTIDAPALGFHHRAAYVYLPAGYDLRVNDHRRYPVVYLLHGTPGGAIDWMRAGAVQTTMDTLVADHLIQPMIVVAPSSSWSWVTDSECLDTVRGPRAETYLTSVVVGWVDSHFRTIADRADRAIGGMSSGAYCALNLGLRHQHEFSVLLAHEPYGTPGLNAEHRLLDGSAALYRANSPIEYLPTLRFSDQMAVFLDAGSDDQEGLREVRRLAVELADRGQVVAMRVAAGSGHTWREARLELPYSLIFADQHLGAHKL
jgi:enterochelin esterase-like enzyme